MDKEMIRLRIIRLQDAVKNTSSPYLKKDYRKRIKRLQKDYNKMILAERKEALSGANASRLGRDGNE